MGVEIEGLDRLLAKLKRIDNELAGQVMESAMDKAARRVQRDAKALCPVDTGRLRNSIEYDVSHEGSNVVGTVKSNLEYAPYIEYGTGRSGAGSAGDIPEGISFREDWGGNEAQPFLYPALNQNRDKAASLMAAEIKKHVGD